jgi:hypothetical protein
MTSSSTATRTLADLTARTGLEVLDHLERELTTPVTDGIQAQGDLIVIPFALVEHAVTELSHGHYWHDVPTGGLELLRSAAGGNPHSLVADDRTCRWNRFIRDTTGLAIGMLEASAFAYLIHPEHGASAIAPGRYVIRRQREHGRGQNHLVAD